jgi:hypothetical protein
LNQTADFVGDCWPAAARAGSPTPVTAESSAVPAGYGVGHDDDENVLPAGPVAAEGGPEQPVHRVQYRAWPLAFEDGDLLSEGEDFKSSVASTSKEDAEYRKHGEDELGHEITLLTWRNVASSRQSLEILSQ